MPTCSVCPHGCAQGSQIDHITVTLDSHQVFDIAHPAFWQQVDGSDVSPFTAITAAQVRAGQFSHASLRIWNERSPTWMHWKPVAATH